MRREIGEEMGENPARKAENFQCRCMGCFAASTTMKMRFIKLLAQLIELVSARVCV